MLVRLGEDVQPLPVLLSRRCAQVLTDLFLLRAVLLTIVLSMITIGHISSHFVRLESSSRPRSGNSSM